MRVDKEHYHHDLNTSYVKVQHFELSNMKLSEYNLNTSYVKVQRTGNNL